MNKILQYSLLGLVSVALVGGGVLYAKRDAFKPALKNAIGDYKAAQNNQVVQSAILNGTREPQDRAEKAMNVYSDGKLDPEWQDFSWGKHDLNSQDSGKPALKFEPKGYEGVYLHRGATTLEGYGTLEFMLRQSTTNDIRIALARPNNEYVPDGKAQPPLLVRSFIADAKQEGNWLRVQIPLSKFPLRKGEEIAGLVFQANTGEAQSALFINNIRFLPDKNRPESPKEVTVEVAIETSQGKHVISPLIYGMAFAPQKFMTDLKLGINRWGGNDKTRYNWAQGNAVNAASDWEFRNRIASDQFPAGTPARPSLAADAFIDANNASGTKTMLTIPTIGWVAKNNDNNTKSAAPPPGGAMPLPGTENDLSKIQGYDATENRRLTSVPSVARKKAPFTDKPDPNGPVAQDEWVAHLTKKYGNSASKTGVHFYAMDNEPDLWFNTHRDITPGFAGYDQILSRFQEYASAVKDVDPTALVTGPVSWGWTGYEYSPLDKGEDNYHTLADQKAHGGKKFLPWFLSQMKTYDAKQGKRTLDYLDIHYYPQSYVYNSTDMSDAMQSKRLRATQSLWNADYTDESWIGTPIRLIPLMKEWIAQNYPGTKLGITEWNFGGDQTIDGALAIVDTLGIYGREGVDMACYWAYPNDNSPGYQAFKLLRNPDGAGTGFGDIACEAKSATPLKVASYAAIDSKTKEVTVLLINKLPHASATVPVTIAGLEAGTVVRFWKLAATGDDLKQTHITPGTLKAGKADQLSVTLPPYCAMLLRLPALTK